MTVYDFDRCGSSHPSIPSRKAIQYSARHCCMVAEPGDRITAAANLPGVQAAVFLEGSAVGTEGPVLNKA